MSDGAQSDTYLGTGGKIFAGAETGQYETDVERIDQGVAVHLGEIAIGITSVHIATEAGIQRVHEPVPVGAAVPGGGVQKYEVTKKSDSLNESRTSPALSGSKYTGSSKEPPSHRRPFAQPPPEETRRGGPVRS